MRSLLLAVAVLATATIAASAATGARIIGVKGTVAEISADGGQVAISSHFETLRVVCDRAAVWRPVSGSVVRFNRPKECRENFDANDDGVADLFFAGGRAVFTDYSYGNYAYCNAVRTATIRRPEPALVGNAPCSGQWGDGDQFFQFTGSGSLIAVASYVYCSAEECEAEKGGFLPEGHYRVVLWRLSRTKLVRLARLEARSRLLTADAGRIAVLRPDGAIVLYSLTGRVLRELLFAKGAVLGARLSGSRLVVRTRDSLDVLDAANGARVRTRLLPRSARLADVEGGLVVYVNDRSIRLLRLRDGRDRLYARVDGVGPVDVELEPSGLFYAYNEREGSKPGRVVFVPTADLVRILS